MIALQEALDIPRCHADLACDVEAHHPQRHAASEHDVCRFGITPDVEFSDGRCVADLGCPTHDADGAEPACETRLLSKGHGDVGERTDRANHQFLAIAPRHFNDEIDRMRVHRVAVGIGQFGAIDAGFAVDIPAMAHDAVERSGAP